MSNKWYQGIETATTPASNLGGNSISGVYTLDQLNTGTAIYGQQVQRSVRLRSSVNAYFNRTPASASSRTTFTWSGWVKKAKIAANQYVFGAEVGGSGSFLYFTSSDTLQFYDYAGGSYQFQLISSQVFRDPSAWYHIVLVSDTTQATASNRIRLYVNGAQITAFGTATYPSQNYANSSIDNNNVQYIGYTASALDGYLSEVTFVDGQALDPSYFGQYGSETGVWQPKKYQGTYGTNGFYLPFTDATSTTTLGYDYSGNSNNWTSNNISLTAGSTYDSMIDVPTNWVGGDPVQARGNYAVLNPLVQSANTFSNGNLTVTTSASTPAKFVSSIGATSGKWYMEFGLSALSNAPIGISKDTTPRDYLGMSDGSSSVSFWPASSGTPIYVNGSSVAWSGSGTTWTTSDVAGLALDVDASTIAIYKNGSLVGAAFSYSSYWTGLTYFAGGNYVSGIVYTANFGQRPFAYTPPSGYKSLCTQNLPIPTTQKGNIYMDATLYTGNASTQTIVNAGGFQPDLVWTKSRTYAYNHMLYDSVRGPNTILVSNQTNAETVISGSLTSFNSNGFSLGANDNSNFTSGSASVAWQWKAGGTAVSNTAGSITSSVSANPTAGFSVVTFTTQSSGTGTVGHGLGVAPSMMILKVRNAVNGWPIYHISTGTSGYLLLNSTVATQVSSNAFTGVSSTTFTLGTDFAGGLNYVAYCFAAIPGYSAFGSYTGNGSSDGPFVYLGFRPRFILTKMTNTSGNYWIVHDTARDPYNAATKRLYPNVSDAEATATDYDILSNGFKLRTTAEPNGSGNTFIYAAFAENPFKYSLAR